MIFLLGERFRFYLFVKLNVVKCFQFVVLGVSITFNAHFCKSDHVLNLCLDICSKESKHMNKTTLRRLRIQAFVFDSCSF